MLNNLELFKFICYLSHLPVTIPHSRTGIHANWFEDSSLFDLPPPNEAQTDQLLLENWFHPRADNEKDLRICSSLWRNMLPSASWCGRDPITIGGLWAPNCHQQSRSKQGCPTYPGRTHHINLQKCCLE